MPSPVNVALNCSRVQVSQNPGLIMFLPVAKPAGLLEADSSFSSVKVPKKASTNQINMIAYVV